MTLYLIFKPPPLLVCILILYQQTIYAQSIPKIEVSDTLFKNSKFQRFIQKQWTQLGLGDSKTLLDQLSFAKDTLPHLPITANGSVSLDYFWNQGDTLLYGDAANQSFSYLTADLNLSILSVPVRVGSSLVMQGTTWRRDLSTYTCQVDYETLLAQKKQALKTRALQESAKKWTQDEREAWQKRLEWDALYNMVYSPEFQATKQDMMQKLDSLKQNTEGVISDSLQRLKQKIGGGKIETWQDSLRRLHTKTADYQKAVLGYLQKIETQKKLLESQLQDYGNAQKHLDSLITYYLRNNSAFQKADSLRGLVEQLEGEWANRKNKVDGLKNGLKGKISEKVKQWTGSIEQLEVGSVWLTQSDLTARSMLLNGIHVQAQTGKVYNELAFGRQNTATRDYQVGFQTLNGARDLNRQVAFLRSGVGQKDSNFLHISLMRILDSDSGRLRKAVRPHYNDILDISMQEKLGKIADLTADIAYSVFQNTATQNWGSAPEMPSTAATATKDHVGCQIRLKSNAESRYQWSIGYDYLGRSFTTLGNPYLLNNRQILRGALGGNFWNKKLTIKLRYDKSVGLPNGLDWQPQVDQTGFSAEVGVRYGKSNRFSAKLAPRYFLVSAMGGTEGVGRSDVYTIQNTLQGKIGQIRWLSFINLTNLNLLMPMRDSGQLSGLNYFFTQNSLFLSKKWTLSLVGNMGLEGKLKNTQVREATAQLNSQWTFKTGVFGLGVQTFKTVSSDVQVGGHLNGSFQTKKWGVFGFQLNYRESVLVGQAKQPIVSGQTFYRYSF